MLPFDLRVRQPPPFKVGWTSFKGRIPLEEDGYATEEESRPVDRRLLRGESDSAVYGRFFQINVPLNHREAILTWMSKACDLAHWTFGTFYNASFLFDSYVMTCEHRISPDNLAPLATACLFSAARLRESMSDDCTYYLSANEFRRVCPEIGSGYMIRTQEAHLIQQLQGRSMCNRTPYDLGMMWLRLLEDHAATKPIFQFLHQQNLLDPCLDCILQVANACVLNGICLLLPASTWVACTALYIIRVVATEGLGLTNGGLRMNCYQVFADDILRYPGGLEPLKALCDSLFKPIIEAVFTVMGSSLGQPRAAATTKNTGSLSSPTRSRSEFRMYPLLLQDPVSSYRSSIVTTFRANVLPTLKRTKVKMREKFISPKTTTDASLPMPRSHHTRRHTAICVCPRCTYYVANVERLFWEVSHNYN